MLPRPAALGVLAVLLMMMAHLVWIADSLEAQQQQQQQQQLASRCPAGWLSRPGSGWCYLLVDSAASYRSWGDAKLACAVQRAHLLSVSDADERDWLAHTINPYQTVGDRYWWLGLSRHGSSWNWEADSGVRHASVALLSFWPGITDFAQGLCMAAYQDPGSRGLLRVWPRDCSSRYKYICKKPGQGATACDTGWELLHGRCYRAHSFEGDAGADWDEARSKCTADEAELASVPDQSTGAAIRSLVSRSATSRGSQAFWLGLRTQPDSADPSGFAWRWSDGSRLAYEAWNNGARPRVAPDRFTDTCLLAQGSGERMQWRDVACSGGRHGYVCARAAGACPSGWYRHRDTCYAIHLAELSWDEADAHCWSRGASLIQIRQKHVQDFINTYRVDFAKQGVAFIWIGIYQATRSHTLTWTSDGEAVTGYTNWADNEPLLDPTRPNAGRLLVSNEQGRWQTANPVDRGGFVCELPLGKLPLEPTKETPRFHCKAGWQLHGRSCLKVMPTPVDWLEARQLCRALPGGDLADIRDAAELESVQGRLDVKRSVWIGLRARGGRVEDGRWVWSLDGGQASFFNWRPGSPSADEGAACVQLGPDGRWSNVGCHHRVPFVCELPAALGSGQPAPLTTQPPAWDPVCGPFWSRDPATDQCYLVNADPLSWLEAKHQCEHKGGRLLSIASESEKAHIVSIMHAATSANPGIVNFWLGFNDRAVEGLWVWEDGQPAAYLNWAPGEPDNTGDGEDCALLHPGTGGLWFDAPCRKRYASVCKKPGNRPTAPPPPPPPLSEGAGCRAGYSGFRAMCYRVHGSVGDAVTWDEALKRCRAEGGSLASVTDRAEHQFLRELARLQGDFSFWIGLYDRISLQRTMQFQWVDRSPVSYTSWHVARPSNHGVKEDCVEVVNEAGWNGNWNDLPCSEARRFVCKQAHTRVPPGVAQQAAARPHGCPADYSEAYDGYCLNFVTGGNPVTAEAAQKRCRHSGGTLATIPTEDVQNHFLLRASELKATSDFWIGLARAGYAFQWDDRRPVTYTNWRPGAPLVGTLRASMSAQTGLWQMSSSADAAHLNYVCQARQQQQQQREVAPPSAQMRGRPLYPSCPQGWLAADGSCYRGFAQPGARLSWAEARTQCRKHHADLATLNSEEVLVALGRTLGGATPYWIGLNTRDANQGLVWANGKPVRLLRWRGDREPGVGGYGARNCVQLHASDMAWSAEDCGVAQNWLCELSIGAL